jgi:hypothetical protein
MASTPPPFDFTNLTKQLQTTVSKAISDGFKGLDLSDIGKKIQKSISKIGSKKLLDLDTDMSSLKDINQEIETLQKIRQAGGKKAYEQQISQEAILKQQRQSFFDQQMRMGEQLSGQQIRNSKGQYSTVEQLRNSEDKADKLVLRNLEKKYKNQKKIADELAKNYVDELEKKKNIQNFETLKNETQEEYLRNTDLLKAKLDKIKAITTDPKLMKTVLATEGIRLLINGMKALGEEFKKFREQGQTATQALKGTFESLTLNSVLFGVKTGDAIRSTQNVVGDLNAVSADAADQMGKLALITGASAESVGKLQGNLQQIPGQTAASSAATAEFAANLARAANVAPGKVLDTMANSSEEIAKFSADGGQNFARAAVGAQKMGIEVSKIAQAAEGLLEFENSINKQMEASVLLGREINLDKAREKALQGDLLGASQEMLRNVGGEAEFNKMNLLQKKALAETMGMSVADLGKMVKNQGKFNDAQKEAIANGATMDEVRALSGGFLEKWGGGLKDLGVGLLQAIPTMLVYTTNLSILTATKNAAAVAQGRETVAENTGLLSRIRSMAATMRQTVVENARRLGRLFGIGVTTTETVAENTSTATKGRGVLATLALNAVTLVRNVIVGAGNVILGIANGLLSLFGVNTAAAGTAGAGATPGIVAFGTAIGTAGAAMVPAIPVILALGAALLMATPAIYVIGEVIKSLATVIGNVLMKALEMLPAIIGAVVSGFQVIFGLLAANWKILIPVGFGMMALAGGVAALGAAFLFAYPGLMLGALAMTMMAVPIVAIGAALQYIATSAAGLTMVGAAIQSIGSGLGVMAVNGLAAMPVIGALIGLAAVAPALSKLGDVLGGGGSGAEQDKMAVVAEKLDTLISIVSKPAAVTLDGRKVGDAIRLNINGTAIR